MSHSNMTQKRRLISHIMNAEEKKRFGMTYDEAWVKMAKGTDRNTISRISAFRPKKEKELSRLTMKRLLDIKV